MADMRVKRGKADAQKTAGDEQEQPAGPRPAKAREVGQQIDEMDLRQQTHSALDEDQNGNGHRGGKTRDNAFAEIVDKLAFAFFDLCLFLDEGLGVLVLLVHRIPSLSPR